MLVLMASPVSAVITVQNWAELQNTTSTDSPTISTTYTPTAAPDVAIVWCTSYNDYYSGGDAWSGATYGGTSMTKVDTAEDTNGEPGEVTMFYLLNPPSGNVTAQCTHVGSAWKDTIGSGAVSIVITSLTTNYGGGFELSDSGVAQDNQVNPSVGFSGLSGTYRMIGGLYSGHGTNSNLSAGSGMFLNNSASSNGTCATGSCDVGARYFATTYSSSDQTSSTNSCSVTADEDDVAMVCAVFAEVVASRKIFLIQ